jgi:hypothetical protein
MRTPKLIYVNGPFEVYKAGHVLIINENGEFFCNLRKADNGFSNPPHFVDEILRCRADAAAEWAAVSDERKARLESYLASRRGRVEAQPAFAF